MVLVLFGRMRIQWQTPGIRQQKPYTKKGSRKNLFPAGSECVGSILFLSKTLFASAINSKLCFDFPLDPV